MARKLASWMDGMNDTAKALIAIITIIMFTITATLAVAQQAQLPKRVTALEVAVDTLRTYAAENRHGIQDVRKDTQTILCILALPPDIPPMESRLRCP